MAKKITIELIEQLISEEIDNLPVETMDELTNPLAGVASGIKAMGGGLKAQFQKGRAGALGQKIAKKYQGQMAKVQQQLNKVNQNFEKEYAGYAKNPFLKQMLDDAKVMQQLQTAQRQQLPAQRQQLPAQRQQLPAQQHPKPRTSATPPTPAYKQKLHERKKDRQPERNLHLAKRRHLRLLVVEPQHLISAPEVVVLPQLLVLVYHLL